jgi:acetolactate synthase-1/2/3 large subunit
VRGSIVTNGEVLKKMTDAKKYTSSDLIADFIYSFLSPKVFLVTGGACAFIVDAIGRHKDLDFVCFQHEQSAAMAADAAWRTTGKIGVTLATSGPGATNLITGIACSWFDSIPAIHITGQVNQSENRESIGANVRQAGFQETDIVSMVQSVTKWAHQVKDVGDLISSLKKAYEIATSGRMGPVLLDIPMNLQSIEITEAQKKWGLSVEGYKNESRLNKDFDLSIKKFLEGSNRPLVILGAGAGLSGSAKAIQLWCEKQGLPYVASWGGLTYLDRSLPNYQGSIGVYGSRNANWAIQAADRILVLGSRLDNRQRTGNPKSFAPFAELLVADIDIEELNKYSRQTNYDCIQIDLANISDMLPEIRGIIAWEEWLNALSLKKKTMPTGFESAVQLDEFNPYLAVNLVQQKFPSNSIVVSDTGANLCWVFQSYLADDSFLFTAGGNSPMGYSLPAAIGAQILNPKASVFCFIGDGGLQMNIQELQTIVNYKLPIKIIILNNNGYGIIKQFQDAYLGNRYFATGTGYSTPSFEGISKAFNIAYVKIHNEVELEKLNFTSGPMIIDLIFQQNSLITPKTEMDHFIHDQFPYIQDDSIVDLPFKYPASPSKLAGGSGATV